MINLKESNKTITSNKTKHVETQKKLTDQTNKTAQISRKRCDFLFGRMYFTGDDGYQDFLVFAPILVSLTLTKDTTWISNRISSEKLNHFMLTMSRPCII